MFQAEPLREYTRLLSVQLYRVMEEGEALLLGNKYSPMVPPAPFLEQMQQASDWLSILARLDPDLLPGTIPLSALTTGKATQALTIEELVNAAAQTLMLLDDRYKVFGSGRQATASVMIPVMQINEIGSETEFPKPQPVQ